MGSFYRKSDKKDDWVFQYLDNGKRHYKVLVGLGDLSKDQRKKYKRKLEVQYEDNKKVRTSVGTQTRRILSTIDVYLEERTKKVKLQTLSQNTLDGDIKRIGYFGDFVKSKFGNISMEDEPIKTEFLSMAQATRTCGGKIYVQVLSESENMLSPKYIYPPSHLVDAYIGSTNQKKRT